ncbi:hypothetical protein [Nitriliruptor alkaliphilus]|uniref:hypothetical protein n=1 Tax=Nitriliruptor alkaliphilus TaxID=427918 RepID=UPI000696BE32|nr:hypothetical protein [Nitriliruptor alkaliphilus]
MTGLPLVLAHAGEGATWQALLVVASLGLAVVFVLAVVGRVQLGQADDLVLPLAGVAIASSLAPLGSAWLSDWVGWAFPVGVVVLVALLLVAMTPLEFGPTSPITYGTLALAVICAALLYNPITQAWHPPADFLPLADDSEVVITGPADGDTVDAGEIEVTVYVTGGSLQSDLLAVDQLPDDPEEAGHLAVAVDGRVISPRFAERCTVDAPCTEVSFPITVEPGERRLVVEFRRGDGAPLTPLVTDAVTFEAS